MYWFVSLAGQMRELHASWFGGLATWASSSVYILAYKFLCLNSLFSCVLFDKSFGILSRTCSRNGGAAAAAAAAAPAPLSQTVSLDHFNDRVEFRICDT